MRLMERDRGTRHFLLASDFDQTLSFNDSGILLSEMLGIPRFAEKCAGLSAMHLVQQDAELAYLLLHDPEFRRVRKEDLEEVGRRIRLKQSIPALTRMLDTLPAYQFTFCVVSAAPEEVIRSALAGLVPPERIYATRFRYDNASGEIQSIVRVPAGYGKVAVLEQIRADLGLGGDRIVYVGDGSSDVHVMLHVNRLDGLTVAVSENKVLTPIAKRTILSDDALSVLVPVLEEIVGLDSTGVRALFGSHGFVLQEWDKARTDSLIIRGVTPSSAVA